MMRAGTAAIVLRRRIEHLDARIDADRGVAGHWYDKRERAALRRAITELDRLAEASAWEKHDPHTVPGMVRRCGLAGGAFERR